MQGPHLPHRQQILAQATHIHTYGAGFGDLVDGGAHHIDYRYFITHTPQTKYYT